MGKQPAKKKGPSGLFNNMCFSEYEGCCCGRRKGHIGIHACASKKCTTTWNDTEAQEWWDELMKEYEQKE